MNLTNLINAYRRLVHNLSKGYKQCTGIAQVLIGNPEVIILDERAIGLDPVQIMEIRTLIDSLGKDHTILLSSHIFSEVSKICNRFVVINNDKIVALDAKENLSNASRIFLIRIAGQKEKIKNTVLSTNGVRKCECLGSKESGTYDFRLEMDRDNRIALFEAFSASSLPIMLMKPLNETLENIFLKLTKKELSE